MIITLAVCRKCNVYEDKQQGIYPVTSIDKAQKAMKPPTIYFIKQKLCGLAMIVIGIICPILLDGDATFSLIAIPIGIGLLVTKQRLMDFSD